MKNDLLYPFNASPPKRACSTRLPSFFSLFNLSSRCAQAHCSETENRKLLQTPQWNKYHRINSTQPAITEPMMTESRRRRELIIPTIELSAGT